MVCELVMKELTSMLDTNATQVRERWGRREGGGEREGGLGLV